MDKTGAKRSPIRWIFRIFLILFLSAIGLFVYKFQLISDTALRKQLKQVFEEAGLEPGQVQYGKLTVRPLNHKIIIDSIRINKNKDLRSVLVSASGVMPLTILGSIDQVVLGGWNIRKTLKSNVLNFDQLSLSHPTLSIIASSSEREKPVDGKCRLSLGKFKSLEVGKLEIILCDFEYYDVAKGFDYQVRVDSLNCFLYDVRIDTSWFDSPTPVRADQINLTASHLITNLVENYTIESQQIIINSRDRYAFIDDLHFRPHHFARFDETGLPVSGGFNMTNKELVLTGFDLSAYYHEGGLVAEKIELRGLDIVFLNYSLPKQEKQDPLFPGNLIRGYPGEVSVDSFNILNSSFIFMEQPLRHSPPGIIRFTDVQLRTGNITNHERKLKRDPAVGIHLATSIMDTGQFKLTAQIKVLDTMNQSHVTGQLGTMDFAAFNPVSENLGLVSFRAGSIDTLYFNITLNKDSIEGELDFAYHDLRLEIHQDMKQDYRFRRKRAIYSFMANNMVKSNNDPGSNSYRPGEIKKYRQPDESYSGFLIEGLKDGIIQSLAPAME
jgi:hypothetical protein